MITWSELPNYKDVVIPKTELYYRSKLMEQVDVSVEIHLWRRKLAVVKRFKFDLLTRDNIKFFKAEANIFQRLKHENIVDFYGVLVDPPSLGIVMQFCSNGDVFKILEKERIKFEKEEPSSKEDNDEDTESKLNRKMTGRSSLFVTDLHVVKSMGRTSSEENDQSEADDRSRVLSVRSPDHSSILRSMSGSKLGQSNNRLGSIRVSLMGSRHGDQPPNQFDPLFCALQVTDDITHDHLV